MAHSDSEDEQEPFEDVEEYNEEDAEDLDAVEEATEDGDDVCFRPQNFKVLVLISCIAAPSSSRIPLLMTPKMDLKRLKMMIQSQQSILLVTC